MSANTEKEDKNLEARVERWWKGADLVTLACIVVLAVIYQDYMAVRQKIYHVRSGEELLGIVITFFCCFRLLENIC